MSEIVLIATGAAVGGLVGFVLGAVLTAWAVRAGKRMDAEERDLRGGIPG